MQEKCGELQTVARSDLRYDLNTERLRSTRHPAPANHMPPFKSRAGAVPSIYKSIYR